MGNSDELRRALQSVGTESTPDRDGSASRSQYALTRTLDPGVVVSKEGKDFEVDLGAHNGRLLRVLDNTALNNYMVCPRKYALGMVLHYRRQGKKPPAIVYGIAWHAILEAHLKTDGDLYAVGEALVQSWTEHDRVDDHRTKARCFGAYMDYRAQYGASPHTRSEEKTLGWPNNPAVELSTNALIPGAVYPYAGRIDHVYEQSSLAYVEDHKSTSRLGETYFQQFYLSNQMMGYALLASALVNKPIHGVRINAHGILRSENRFVRQIVSFTKDQLTEWVQNLNMWVDRIEHSYATNQWPANLNACSGKYGLCEFFSVCSMSPGRRGNVLYEDFTVEEWNPLTAGPIDEFTEH